MYRRYRFDDFLEGKKLDLHYAPGVPHTVLCLPVAEAAERWRLHSQAVYRFFIQDLNTPIWQSTLNRSGDDSSHVMSWSPQML